MVQMWTRNAEGCLNSYTVLPSVPCVRTLERHWSHQQSTHGVADSLTRSREAIEAPALYLPPPCVSSFPEETEAALAANSQEGIQHVPGQREKAGPTR